jgi:hypothetical protein
MLRTPQNRDRFLSDRNAHTYQVEHAKNWAGKVSITRTIAIIVQHCAKGRGCI